jgi:nitrate/TMAO reductase-like tetraheme cytochrome c subunit
MRLRARMLAHPALAIVIVLAFVGAAAAAVPAFQASERAAFCTSCHEMAPYYDAWSQGAHHRIQCIECHADAGALNHVSHKVTAAKELWVHLTGDPRFPQGTAVIPDLRCLSCHASIPTSTGPRFSHKAHATTGTCVTCHADTGHRVTLGALEAAGALKAGAETTTPPAAKNPGVTAAAAHTSVSCAKCHDLAKTPCASCHKPPHKGRGACATCHRPGPAWTFSHPASSGCASCHQAPASHFGTSCVSCHKPLVPWTSATFRHPATGPKHTYRSFACVKCHPSGYASHTCTACHDSAGGGD